MANELVGLTVAEVSAVDRPANAEFDIDRATIALLKRDESIDGLAKGAWDASDELCKAIDGQTVQGKAYPASDFAYVPDKDHPSTWKLRLTREPGGKPDAGIVGAAAAALGKGFRGKKVQIPASALADVKAKVRRAWRAANPDKGAEEMPSVLKGASMTLEQIEKQLTDQGALITKQAGEIETVKSTNAALTTANTVLKSESELVLKMNKKERKAYASMTEDKRKEYMAADETKRKSMVDDASKALKAAAKKDDELEDDDDDMKEAKKRIAELEGSINTLKTDSTNQIAKAETRVAAIEKIARVSQFTAMAEAQLPNTPGSPEEKGARLMKMADALGGEESADFKKTLEDFKAADAAIALGMKEIGKAGGGPVPVEKQIEAKALEIAKRDNITAAKAYDKALVENPHLYAEYEKQHKSAVGPLASVAA